jgi:hypothetical protein
MRRKVAEEQVKMRTRIAAGLLAMSSVAVLVLGIIGPTAFLWRLILWCASAILAIPGALGLFRGWSYGGWREAQVQKRLEQLETVDAGRKAITASTQARGGRASARLPGKTQR